MENNKIHCTIHNVQYDIKRVHNLQKMGKFGPPSRAKTVAKE